MLLTKVAKYTELTVSTKLWNINSQFLGFLIAIYHLAGDYFNFCGWI